jgi:hypothetical protein
MTTLTIPRKTLRPHVAYDERSAAPPGWDIYLDDTLIASDYASLAEAQMELDLVAFSTLFGEAPLAPDIPITDEVLDLALRVFERCFSTPIVQEKARTAMGAILAPHIYSILPDGSLSVLASSGRTKRSCYTVSAHTALAASADDATPPYLVSMTCECRDFYVRAHAHGGVCKHVAARLLLFLAQQGVAFLKHLCDALDTHDHNLDQGENASDADDDAFVTIAAAELAAALFLVLRADAAIELHAEHGQLCLSAGAFAVRIPGTDGDGTASIRLEHIALAELYARLRPIVTTTATLNLFIEADTLVVCGQGDAAFSASVPGESIPSASPTHHARHSDAQTGERKVA